MNRQQGDFMQMDEKIDDFMKVYPTTGIPKTLSVLFSDDPIARTVKIGGRDNFMLIFVGKNGPVAVQFVKDFVPLELINKIKNKIVQPECAKDFFYGFACGVMFHRKISSFVLNN